MKSNCPKPFRWGAATLLAATLALTATCASAQGIKDVLSKAFGSHMNHVAEMITEWPAVGAGVIGGNPVFSADGSLLAFLSLQEKNGLGSWNIDFWDWKNHRLVRRLDAEGSPDLALQTLSFSPDGRFLAVCTNGGSHGRAVRVWNTTTWDVAHDIVDTDSSSCSAVAFSQDSRVLLRVDYRALLPADDVFAYSTDNWQTLWGLRIQGTVAQTLAVSPAGNIAAVGGYRYVIPPDRNLAKVKEQPEVGLLNLQQGKIVKIISPVLALPANVESISWNPDSTKLAIATESDFDIYDVSSGERIVRQSLPTPSSTSICYSPDGKHLVVSGFNGYAGPGRGFDTQIWDGQGKKLLQKIDEQAAGIAFSPDSRYLAVAKRGRIEIWQFK